MDNGTAIPGLRQRTRSRMVEEFVPSSGWTEDADGHYLLVDLPDFTKEEVKLQVDNSGHITVSGERKVRDSHYSYFEKTHELPDNADVDMITGKFDGEILCVTVPKKKVEREEEQQNEIINAEGTARETERGKSNQENNSSEDEEEEHENEESDSSEMKEESKKKAGQEHLHREDTEKCEQDKAYILNILFRKLSNNKGIVLTAVFAFSVGVLVSRKFG